MTEFTKEDLEQVVVDLGFCHPLEMRERETKKAIKRSMNLYPCLPQESKARKKKHRPEWLVVNTQC